MDDFIKKKIRSLKPSTTLAINEKAKKLSSQGKKIYNFGFGQSPFPIPEKIVLALKKNAARKDYLPMQGLKELRSAISKSLFKRTGIEYDKDNIIITPGSKEAMLLMHVAFNGEIILPAPSWVSYEPQAQIAENRVHWLDTSRDNNWFPTAEDLEKKIKLIGNKNIILIINSPNNPSGTVCKNLKEIAMIAKKYKIKILSDEIYTDLTFDQNYLSISKFYPEGTFISGGLSKWCGAGGWRLGFFASPDGKQEFISALNIAPQFGVFQTKFVIDECVKFGVDTTNFLNKCYESKKWEKWLLNSDSKDVYKCSILAGHYNFQDKSYKIIMDSLNKIHGNFNKKIVDAHYEIIDHYVENFY